MFIYIFLAKPFQESSYWDQQTKQLYIVGISIPRKCCIELWAVLERNPRRLKQQNRTCNELKSCTITQHTIENHDCAWSTRRHLDWKKVNKDDGSMYPLATAGCCQTLASEDASWTSSSLPLSLSPHITGNVNSSASDGNGGGDTESGDRRGIGVGGGEAWLAGRRGVESWSRSRARGACLCSLVGGFPTLSLVLGIGCACLWNMLPSYCSILESWIRW